MWKQVPNVMTIVHLSLKDYRLTKDEKESFEACVLEWLSEKAIPVNTGTPGFNENIWRIPSYEGEHGK